VRILALVVFTWAWASTAAADEASPATAVYQRGVAAYGAHDYEAAVTLFKDAYALDPRPEVLFAWAQAERLSGDCESAIALYKKFLDGNPPPVQAEAAKIPLERCERSLPPKVVESPPPAPAPPQPPPAIVAAPPPPPPPAPRRFYQDALGDTLVGAGVVAAAVGVGLLASAGSPDGAATWEEFQSRHDSAVARTRAGAIVAGVGAALVVGGVTRWVIWSGGGGETGVAVAGRF
jgi:hypothetical protein